MSERSAIEWTDATWNPLTGTLGRWSCVKISPGCTHCYAERMNVRFGGPKYVVGADTLRLDEKALTEPLRWKKPRRVFVCSMTDLFEERVPEEWLDRIFAVMHLGHQHSFQVLTKRAERMHEYLSHLTFERMRHWMNLPPDGGDIGENMTTIAHRSRPSPIPPRTLPPPLRNVWLGVSAEDQPRLDERVPWLLKTPAAMRFLSLEPLLGPIEIRDPVDWVIVGGESGGPRDRSLADHGVRPSPQAPTGAAAALKWVRAIRDDCAAAGVPFFFKGWGGANFKSGGRLLDGRTWDEMPA